MDRGIRMNWLLTLILLTGIASLTIGLLVYNQRIIDYEKFLEENKRLREENEELRRLLK